MIRAMIRVLLGWLLLAQIATAEPCPPGEVPALYANAALFEDALRRTAGTKPPEGPVSGVIVPHHLEVPDLVAGGLRLSSGMTPDRIVVMFPDHFFRLETPFATTTSGFATVLGPVPGDPAATTLLRDGHVAESCAFVQDHGLRAILPFLARLHPGVPVLPLAIAINSTRADWDGMAAALDPLIGPETLIVQATDFSHYLPHHQARQRDQQVLNLIAAGDLDAIASLIQPDHVDSLGALYLSLRLNTGTPVVVANRNLQQTTSRPLSETTSYIVAAFVAPGTHVPPPPFDQSHLYMIGGDLFLGRSLPRLLSDDLVADRVADAALAATRGLPLILNLEGVLLPDVPTTIPHLVLAMPGTLLTDWAGRLKIRALGLANNHVNDIGASGVAETRRALQATNIAHADPGEPLELPGVTLVPLSDLDGGASPAVDRLTDTDLDRLVQSDAAVPVVALLHWGREYVTVPGPRETDLAQSIARRGVAAIVGAHPHAASAAPRAIAGGDTLVFHSLGNFLFDQTGARSSGALVELRTFAQGTVFLRQLPLPQLFDIARGAE